MSASKNDLLGIRRSNNIDIDDGTSSSNDKDNDVDTLGLRWDDEANLGGAELDTSSVAVSAITAPYNIPASPPRR